MGNEIITAGSISFIITLIGLALGFALLKLQGEQYFQKKLCNQKKEFLIKIPSKNFLIIKYDTYSLGIVFIVFNLFHNSS